MNKKIVLCLALASIFALMNVVYGEDLTKTFKDLDDPGKTNSGKADEMASDSFIDEGKLVKGKDISPPSGFQFAPISKDVWAKQFQEPSFVAGYVDDGSGSLLIKLRWPPSFIQNAAVFPMRATGNLTAPGTGEGGKIPTWKLALTSPPEIDLDVDSNNDGSIESDNENEDKFEEDAPGVIVCVDKKGISKNLDHLIPLKIKPFPKELKEGTLELVISTGADKIKIWEDKAKQNKAGKYNLETDIVPKKLYIDGIKKGNSVIDLVYKTKDKIEAGRDKVAVSVVDTISFSPHGSSAFGKFHVYTWEPINYSNGPGRSAAGVNAVLKNLKGHGWDVVNSRFEDKIGDNKPGNCTLSNFKNMSNGGIVILHTHGTKRQTIAAQYFRSKRAAKKWKGNTPNDEMKVKRSSKYTNPQYWYIDTTKKWFKKHWKSKLNSRKAITVFLSCHSADGGKNSVVCAAGGRVQFGYENRISAKKSVGDMNKLFGCLNGSLDNSKKRTVEYAYSGGGGYNPNFKMFGNPWTTLNPAPILTGKTGLHGNDKKGAGNIVFDTFMWAYGAANKSVVFTKGTGSKRRWFGYKKQKFGISFDFKKSIPKAKALAEHCRNDGRNAQKGRKLTGDRKKYGSNKKW